MFSFISLALKHLLFFALHYDQDKYPDKLSATKEAELFAVMKKESKGSYEYFSARDEIISHNLRLVKFVISRNFYDISNFPNHDESLLFSFGSEGLIKAVDSFKPDLNNKFSTYATSCIKNEILMYLRRRFLETLRIEDPIGDDDGDGHVIGDTIADEKDEIKALLVKTEIKTALKPMSDLEKKVIRLRYDEYFREQRTQKEVGEILGISRAYVARIEGKVKKQFRIFFDSN